MKTSFATCLYSLFLLIFLPFLFSLVEENIVVNGFTCDSSFLSNYLITISPVFLRGIDYLCDNKVNKELSRLVLHILLVLAGSIFWGVQNNFLIISYVILFILIILINFIKHNNPNNFFPSLISLKKDIPLNLKISFYISGAFFLPFSLRLSMLNYKCTSALLISLFFCSFIFAKNYFTLMFYTKILRRISIIRNVIICGIYVVSYLSLSYLQTALPSFLHEYF